MGITSRSMDDALFTRAWVTPKQLHRQKPNPQLQERLKLHSSPLVPLSQTVCFFDLEEGGALWMLFQELSEICSCSVPKEASSTETSWLKKPYWCTVGCWSQDFSVVCNDKQHLRNSFSLQWSPVTLNTASRVQRLLYSSDFSVDFLCIQTQCLC